LKSAISADIFKVLGFFSWGTNNVRDLMLKEFKLVAVKGTAVSLFGEMCHYAG